MYCASIRFPRKFWIFVVIVGFCICHLVYRPTNDITSVKRNSTQCTDGNEILSVKYIPSAFVWSSSLTWYMHRLSDCTWFSFLQTWHSILGVTWKCCSLLGMWKLLHIQLVACSHDWLSTYPTGNAVPLDDRLVTWLRSLSPTCQAQISTFSSLPHSTKLWTRLVHPRLWVAWTCGLVDVSVCLHNGKLAKDVLF